MNHTESKLSSLSTLLDELHHRSYDDEYVLQLKAEIEDETKARTAAEGRADSAEERIRQLLEQSTREESPATDEVAILEHQLNEAKEELGQLYESSEALASEKESLALQLSHVRVQLSNKEHELITLREDLASSTEHQDDTDSRVLTLNREIALLTSKLENKEEELHLQSLEFESLKRDATALRDQLLASTGGGHAMSNKPSPRRHFRTNSAPFSPSPLRNASFPPLSCTKTGSPLSQRRIKRERRNLLASSDTSSDEDEPEEEHREEAERAIILVARLREERDEAAQQLQYYLLEHQMSAAIMQTEREELANRHSELESLYEADRVRMHSQAEELEIACEKEQAATSELKNALERLGQLQSRYETLSAPLSRSSSTAFDTSEHAEELEHLKILLSEMEARVLRRTEQIGKEQAHSSQLQMNLSLAEETISELENTVATMEERTVTIQREKDVVTEKVTELEQEIEAMQPDKMGDNRRLQRELLDEEYALHEEVQRKEQQLKGASNLVLQLEQKLREAESLLRQANESNAHSIDENGDELRQVKEQLEGARNLALQLEEGRNAFAAEKHELETRLIAVEQDHATRIERMQSLLDSNAHRQADLLHTVSRTTAREKELDLALHEASTAHQKQVNSFVLTLINSARVTSELRGQLSILVSAGDSDKAEVKSLKASLEAARQALTQAQESQREHVCETTKEHDHVGAIQSDDSLLNSTILALVHASAQLDQLRTEVLAKTASLETSYSATEALQGKLDMAEKTVSMLEVAVARYEEERNRSALVDHELEELQTKLAEVEQSSEAQQAKSVALEIEYKAAMVAKQELEAEVERLQAELRHSKEAENTLLSRVDEFDSLSNEVELLRQESTRKDEHLQNMERELSHQQGHIEELRENLRLAEEEGKNLVTDFNLLSEELERKQHEDETR